MNLGAVQLSLNEISLKKGKNTIPNVKNNESFSSLLSNLKSLETNMEESLINEDSTQSMHNLLEILNFPIDNTDIQFLFGEPFVLATQLANLSMEDIQTSIQNILDEVSSMDGMNLEWPKEWLMKLESGDMQEMEEYFLSFMELFRSQFQTILTNASEADLRNILQVAKYLDHVLANKDISAFQQQIGQTLKEQLQSLKDLLNRQLEQKNSTYKTAFQTILNRPSGKSIENLMIHSPFYKIQLDKTQGSTQELSPTTISLPNVSKMEQLVLLSEQQRPVSSDQLLKQFESILQKATFLRSGNIQTMNLQLHPAHLGTLKIELIRDQHGLTARMLASSSMAKELIESQLHILKQAFAQQNIQIERLEVSNQIYQQQERFEQQNQHFHSSKDDRSNENTHSNDETDNEFVESLQEALLNYEV